MSRRLCLVALLQVCFHLAGVAGPARAANGFPFRPNGRVVFLGDSITEQYQYTTDIEIYLTTRYPAWNLTFLNAGISGDATGGGRNRIERDVLSESPSIVLVNFGMNDAGYENPSQQRRDAYRANQTAIAQRVLLNNVNLVVLSSSAVEARQNPGRLGRYNDELAIYALIARDVAEQQGALFVDQHTPERAILEQMTKDEAPFHAFNDGIHTTPLGGILMARAILLGLGAPATVSDAAIDAAQQTVLSTDRAKISNLMLSASGTLAFDRLDEALPMVPGNAGGWLAIYPYLNNLDDLNYYGLRVQGLTAANYGLYIDGQAAGTLARGGLEKGVNLAPDRLGPIGAQAQRVSQAIDNRNNRLHTRFNVARRSGLADNFMPRDFLALHRGRRDDEAGLFDELYIVPTRESIYSMATPVAHHFELRPASQ
jgi:lysophospholipase L1-like esterase